jgi:hypothetical protein
MRKRLRPAYTPEELRKVYALPHRHAPWIDHRARVRFTVLLAEALMSDVTSGADLSCGDGAILRALRLKTRVFGDFAPGYEVTGPLEETLETLEPVDIYVCSETIEHLDDPRAVLKQIRAKTGRLLLSTPVNAWNDTNPEHYWAWDRAEVEALLASAGFTVSIYVALDMRPAGGDYCFGIWACT